jgi:hypothetical protein
MMMVTVNQNHGVPAELLKISWPAASVPGGAPTFWKPTCPLRAGMRVASRLMI